MSFASSKPNPPVSSTFDDAPTAHAPIQHPLTQHALQWGLASMFLSGILVVLGLLTLQICVHLFFGPPIWAREDLRNIFWVSILGAVTVLGLVLAGGAFGIVSIASALRRGQPCALGLAGLLMSVFALGLWIFVFIDLFSVVGFLMRRQGHGGIF